ncbi:MarR family transcriptional regulator [Bifidobacterium sp. DSM 109958]|uniref:MarR family transcriptional regulator n=1 Tax=Bifidobacterium moraviense TaxID=2675323 RepID=A0A7Y0F371_9BIFI|nr:MarR family winged helix-turn-helix transcriptional regulator [Bifidobacterium sp. DSM 109958]NMN01205.1 MarR family transcriptional regulator [Bifidobacterium sp. DSM 109958]
MTLPVEEVRRLMDACWKAKAITELMPALPPGFKPRYVHVIDAIWNINEPGGQDVPTARVSDVSAFLGVTTPSVTKLVGEMTERGLVTKHAAASDRRAVTLALTERGLRIRRVYVEDYHAHLSRLLDGLSSEQCETAVVTIEATLRLMREDAARRDSSALDAASEFTPGAVSESVSVSVSVSAAASHEPTDRKERTA